MAAALYSPPHPHCHTNSSYSDDFQKKTTIVGGLSSLFASPNIRGCLTEGLGLETRRHSAHTDIDSQYPYSSLKLREQSPVSVLQSPMPCSSTTSPPGRSHRLKPVSFSHHHQNCAFELYVQQHSNKLEVLRISRDANFFLRSALSPCVPVDDQEFTFNLEGTFITDDLQPYAEEILHDAQAQHQAFKEDSVVKAFHYAEKAHRGQVRASGDPYLIHCVETSILLAMIGSRENVIIAGLLHDTLDDTPMDYSHLFGIFGKDVADLVQGVSRLSLISQFARDNNTASNSVEADRLHTMFLAMMDVRVVLIKLADRLHNMRTLGALSLQKQQRIAKETLEIFAPLANRLGIWSWKAELEDLCFNHLNPHKYQELSARLAKGPREATIMSAIEKLDDALKKKMSFYNLYGRPKSLYSIYRKMLKKKQKIDEINDLCGLRLIVLNEKDCYDAQRIVHHLWQGVPGESKDYIARPKPNGYQSLHTVVWGEDDLPLEIQIRTREMHQQAEFGVAAHWRYKEGEAEQSSSTIQMVEWARWVLSEMMDTKLRLSSQDSGLRPPCPFPSHRDGWPYMDKFCELPFCTDENLFVIVLEDDKMTVQEQPPNITVKQLLDELNYEAPIKEELRPRVNQKTVSNLNQKLKMGDLVELTPSISDTSLIEYREKMRRLYKKSSQITTLTS